MGQNVVMSGDDTPVVNDRYEIRQRIGRGDTADVFLARDVLLERYVVVKVFLDEVAMDPNLVDHVRHQAQAAANLVHPNIVTVYDWGAYANTYFIAMEYVQGRSLADILHANHRVNSKDVVEIVYEVASALDAAHRVGIVHGGIKPANVLISASGQVKVADFGIASSVMAAAAESNVTPTEAVIGTATYLSPEQTQGAPPDPLSDLYSLGVMMYEMVAGRLPFTAESPIEVAYQQVHDRPTPLSGLVADLPQSFEAIVDRLLAKDPAQRYPNASSLGDDLRRFRSNEPIAYAAAQKSAPPTTVERAATPKSKAPRLTRPRSSRAPQPQTSSELSVTPSHVFVSYSRVDQTYVDHLVSHLETSGVKTWIDRESIDYGTRWARLIRDAIDQCSAFVIVMTPESEDSEWVEREIQRADSEGKPILPLLLRGREFFRLNEIQFEDVRSGEMPSAAFLARLHRLTS
jgi:serine/threonine-protein kinase